MHNQHFLSKIVVFHFTFTKCKADMNPHIKLHGMSANKKEHGNSFLFLQTNHLLVIKTHGTHSTTMLHTVTHFCTLCTECFFNSFFFSSTKSDMSIHITPKQSWSFIPKSKDWCNMFPQLFNMF